MSAMKRLVTLLVLALTSSVLTLGANVSLDLDCEHLNKTLPTKDLHQIFGDWVLVWSVSDDSGHESYLKNLTSTHLELRLHGDNSTVTLHERNLHHHHNSCSTYNTTVNLTVHSDGYDFKIISGTVHEGGVLSHFNHTVKLDFFQSCHDCLLMSYKSVEGHFLLSYKREGHHRDVDQLKAHHSDHPKRAECVGLPHDKPFVYDGVADFCHKKSSPDATGEHS